MSKTNIYESVGSISKYEKLATYYPGYSLPYLVLEAHETFPGYYSALDTQLADRPLYLYLVVKSAQLVDIDHIIRATRHVKQKHSLDFDAVPGELILFNKLYHCIRLDLPDLSKLKSLMDFFQDEKIDFVKHRDVKLYSSMVRLKRYFEVEPIAEGIWKDIRLEGSYYLEVNKMLDFEYFEKISNFVRNNVDLGGFDAACGYWYNRYGLVDFIRIYHRNILHEDLLLLHSKYQRAVETID